jgi:hypothetical protein
MNPKINIKSYRSKKENFREMYGVNLNDLELGPSRVILIVSEQFTCLLMKINEVK